MSQTVDIDSLIDSDFENVEYQADRKDQKDAVSEVDLSKEESESESESQVSKIEAVMKLIAAKDKVESPL